MKVKKIHVQIILTGLSDKYLFKRQINSKIFITFIPFNSYFLRNVVFSNDKTVYLRQKKISGMCRRLKSLVLINIAVFINNYAFLLSIRHCFHNLFLNKSDCLVINEACTLNIIVAASSLMYTLFCEMYCMRAEFIDCMTGGRSPIGILQQTYRTRLNER